MSDLIIEGAKGISDGLYVIKDGELFKYKPNGGSVRSYHIKPISRRCRPTVLECTACENGIIARRRVWNSCPYCGRDMEGEIHMKDKEFEKTLKRIGVVTGVGEDWYEIGDAETENGKTRYGVYAKTDEIADKVGAWLEDLVAERGMIVDCDDVEEYSDDDWYDD